jgi:hypothetical protein
MSTNDWDFILRDVPWVGTSTTSPSKYRVPWTKSHATILRLISILLVPIAIGVISFTGRSHPGHSIVVDTHAYPNHLVLLSDISSFVPVMDSRNKLQPLSRGLGGTVATPTQAYCWSIEASKGMLILPLTLPGVVHTIEIEDFRQIPFTVHHGASHPIRVWGEPWNDGDTNIVSSVHPPQAISIDRKSLSLLSSINYEQDPARTRQNFTVQLEGSSYNVQKLILEVDYGWKRQKKICLRALRVYGFVALGRGPV